jgi:hypothetical protein
MVTQQAGGAVAAMAQRMEADLRAATRGAQWKQRFSRDYKPEHRTGFDSQ